MELNREPNFEKRPPTTNIIIEKGREVLFFNTGRRNSRFKGMEISLGRNYSGGSYSYYKLTNLSRTTNVEVLARSDSGLEKIDLSQEKLQKIAQFLRENSRERESGFDCVSFAHQINNIPYEYGNFDPNKWNIGIAKDDTELKTGDSIILSRRADPSDIEGMVHFAIYLGKGLYLSKFGSSGGLIVTTLEEMKNGFGGKFIFKAQPK